MEKGPSCPIGTSASISFKKRSSKATQRGIALEIIDGTPSKLTTRLEEANKWLEEQFIKSFLDRGIDLNFHLVKKSDDVTLPFLDSLCGKLKDINKTAAFVTSEKLKKVEPIDDRCTDRKFLDIMIGKSDLWISIGNDWLASFNHDDDPDEDVLVPSARERIVDARDTVERFLLYKDRPKQLSLF